MMIKLLSPGKLWLLISLSMMIAPACKSHKKAEQKAATTVTEYPKPASDANLDSLKRALDAERIRKMNERKP